MIIRPLAALALAQCLALPAFAQAPSQAARPAETRNPRAWEQAAFWVGMTALADHGAPADISRAILDMGAANQWLPAKRPYHADDLAITQSYLWAAKHGGGATALARRRRRSTSSSPIRPGPPLPSWCPTRMDITAPSA
jgi:hypothetical protein